MLTEAIRRAEEALDEVLVLSKSGQASTGELRRGLEAFKSMRAKIDACQAHAAGSLAARERHGDGGAGVLVQAAGLSRRDAAVQVETAQRLRALPEVQRAVEDGQVSFANAKVLADASDKTSPEEVSEDSELLAKAASLPPDRFAREAGRWASQRQDDGGEAAWKRLRRRRRLSIWDGDDGMIHLRGEFDPVAGAKLRKRLHEQAESLRRSDLKLPEDERRTRHQRMADALEELTAGRSMSGAGRRSSRRAEIVIAEHLSADGTRDFAEIAGGETIPQSVLDEHMCNARVAGIVFSDKGVPLWHGHTKTIATEAQFRALIAKYGGCAGCGAQPLLCQAHHIRPVSQGGATDIINMIPLCWHCHQKVHHHGWRVVPDGRGLRTIEPPGGVRHGPPFAPDQSASIGRSHRGGVPTRAAGSSLAGDGPTRLRGSVEHDGATVVIDDDRTHGPPRRARALARSAHPSGDGPPSDSGPPVPQTPVSSRRKVMSPHLPPAGGDLPPHTQLQLAAGGSRGADSEPDHPAGRWSR